MDQQSQIVRFKAISGYSSVKFQSLSLNPQVTTELKESSRWNGFSTFDIDPNASDGNCFELVASFWAALTFQPLDEIKSIEIYSDHKFKLVRNQNDEWQTDEEIKGLTNENAICAEVSQD